LHLHCALHGGGAYSDQISHPFRLHIRQAFRCWCRLVVVIYTGFPASTALKKEVSSALKQR
jgi:hypothetical protein